MKTIPGGMTQDEFFRDYWQKKPLLVKQALPDLARIDADELAGYALEENVESRLIIEHPQQGSPLQSSWELIHGPLTARTFQSLPETHWTLLVQAANQLNPAMHSLLEQFRFIPNWRIDDIMVSYAADQGGVGPHFDYYDVFLLQAQGTRHWRLGQMCTSASALRTDTECKILQEFDTSAEWLVEPGDLLYIPPGLAHWGIAKGECITYSVGFRAPSQSDLLLDYTEELASALTEDQRYADPHRMPTDDPGLISAADLAQVRTLLQKSLLNDDFLANWFGRFMTQPRRDAPQFDLKSPYPVFAPGIRSAYRPNDSEQATLYIDGDEYCCSLSLAKVLCSGRDPGEMQLDQQDEALIELLTEREYLV